MPRAERRRPIDVEIRHEPIAELSAYTTISIAFEVRSVFDVSGTHGEWTLTERPIAASYIKDYDAIAAERPANWHRRFDVSRWIMLVARHDDQPIGVATVAIDTPGLDMLEARRDVAALWDIRVAPAHRGRHVGTALFEAVEVAAVERGCGVLRIETQNNNVAACRLYSRCGCVLETVESAAYPDFPVEVRLIWRKNLLRTPQLS